MAQMNLLTKRVVNSGDGLLTLLIDISSEGRRGTLIFQSFTAATASSKVSKVILRTFPL